MFNENIKTCFFPIKQEKKIFIQINNVEKSSYGWKQPSMQTVMNLNLFWFMYVFLALIFQSRFSFHSFNLLLVVLLNFDIIIFVQTAFEILSCSVSNTR